MPVSHSASNDLYHQDTKHTKGQVSEPAGPVLQENAPLGALGALVVRPFASVFLRVLRTAQPRASSLPCSARDTGILLPHPMPTRRMPRQHGPGSFCGRPPSARSRTAAASLLHEEAGTTGPGTFTSFVTSPSGSPAAFAALRGARGLPPSSEPGRGCTRAEPVRSPLLGPGHGPVGHLL